MMKTHHPDGTPAFVATKPKSEKWQPDWIHAAFSLTEMGLCTAVFLFADHGYPIAAMLTASALTLCAYIDGSLARDRRR